MAFRDGPEVDIARAEVAREAQPELAESVLSRLEVASPCPTPWDSMSGGARSRHCTVCDKAVYDVRQLTEVEVLRLLARGGEPPCVRLFRRDDGRVLTKDCTEGRRRRRRRRLRVLGASGAVLAAAALVAPQGAPPPPPPVSAAPVAEPGFDARRFLEGPPPGRVRGLVGTVSPVTPIDVEAMAEQAVKLLLEGVEEAGGEVVVTEWPEEAGAELESRESVDDD